MKLWKKTSAFLATVTLSLTILIGSAPAQDRTVTLVGLNDLHSRIYPYEIAVNRNGVKETVEVGGLARFATIVWHEEMKNPGNTLVTFQGDVNEGPLFYFFHGWPEFCGLNTVGVDVAILGNHEFDLGEESLRETLSYAHFPYTLTNGTTDDPALAASLKPCIVLETGNGMKVGFFGLLTPELASLTSGSGGFTVDQNVVEKASEAVKRLQERNCDLIVALSHCGLEWDRTIASRVQGIHLIMGGHSHTVMETGEIIEGPEDWKTLIGQAGSYSRYAGIMTVTVRGDTLDLDRSGWKLVELDASVPISPSVERSIRPFGKVLDSELETPFARLATPADAKKTSIRRRETALGDFLADAMAWGGETSIGLVNGGGIRGDCIYPKGNISYKTLYSLWPYGNTLVRTHLTGKELREVLEVSASALTGPHETYEPDRRTPGGGFLQISGLRVTLDLSKEPALIDNDSRLIRLGQRVIRVEIREGEGWSELDEREIYPVTAPSWVALYGGDKHYVFRRNTVRKENLEKDDVETLAQYIRLMGKSVTLENQGRIVIKDL